MSEFVTPPAEEANKTPPPEQIRTIKVSHLLACCVDAARLGCAEIRAVNIKSLKSNGDYDRKVVFKDEADSRSALTEADVKAQSVIIGSLRKTFGPHLKIIGEEDGNVDATPLDESKVEVLSSSLISLDKSKINAAEDCVPLEDVCIFVDPLDGTREFVDGRLGNVQSLIGISLNGRAVAGAVGIPFPRGVERLEEEAAPAQSCRGRSISSISISEDPNACSVVYGLVGHGADSDRGIVGVYNAHLRSSPAVHHIKLDEKAQENETEIGRAAAAAAATTWDELNTSTLLLITGDSTNKTLASAKATAVALATKEGVQSAFKICGGAGNKLVQVAEGSADGTIMHFSTCLWDTCAPEAITKAAGGKVTDLFGAPLTHSPNARSVKNLLGVLGTLPRNSINANISDGTCKANPQKVTHAALTGAMRSNRELAPLFEKEAGFKTHVPAMVESQAFDIVRELDGGALRVEYIQEAILRTINSSNSTSSNDNSAPPAVISAVLNSYVCDEQYAVRGMMSDATRLELNWAVGGRTGFSSSSSSSISSSSSRSSDAMVKSQLPESVFYKRVDLQGLSHMRSKRQTAPMKIARDVHSFHVESSFLASKAARALTNAGVGVPLCYDAAALINSNSNLDSKFALIVQDFSPKDGWFMEPLLNKQQAICAVKALAKMHAFFLPEARYRTATGDEELEHALWPSGCYWQPSMQTMEEQVKHLPERFNTHVTAFENEVKTHILQTGAITEEDVRFIGFRLQKCANDVGREAFPFTTDNKSHLKASERLMRQRTVVHGDPKAANIFLRRKSPNATPGTNPAAGGAGEYEIALIDFQWSGFGLPGVDLGHFILSSVSEDALVDDDGQLLIDVYYDSFCACAREFGIVDPVELLSKDELTQQAEASMLDTMRCIFSYQWVGMKAGPGMLERNQDTSRNSYSKRLYNAMWCIRRCHQLLVDRE